MTLVCITAAMVTGDESSPFGRARRLYGCIINGKRYHAVTRWHTAVIVNYIMAMPFILCGRRVDNSEVNGVTDTQYFIILYYDVLRE